LISTQTLDNQLTQMMMTIKLLSTALIISALTFACIDSDPTNRKEFEQNLSDQSSAEQESTQPRNDVRFVTQGEKKPVVKSDQIATEQPQALESRMSDEDSQRPQGDLIQADIVDEPVRVVRQVAETEGFLEWEVPEDVYYDSAELTIVTPDGKRITKNFGGNESMQVNEQLPDGLYKWESVVKPTIQPHVMESLQAARESGDLTKQKSLMAEYRQSGDLQSETEARDNRRSGGFVVRNGIAQPTTSAVTSYTDSD
jgi:hypothetical protein